jgi:glucose/arabinose dehydrogenase
MQLIQPIRQPGPGSRHGPLSRRSRAALLATAVALAAVGSSTPASGTPWDAARRQATEGSNAAAGIRVSLTRVMGGFSKPLYVTNAGDSRLFVVEQTGKIRIISNGRILSTPFFDISGRISKGNEQGLLGFAFHPDYARPSTWGYGRLYVNYTDPAGNTVVSEFRRMSTDPNRASGTERKLLTIYQPYPNHNGGHLAFWIDRYLYIATGDGGGGGDPLETAQRTNTLLGKILRIDPRPTATRPFQIPPNNPYVGRVGLDHIWSLGLRNPWRFSFDPVTGHIWIGDVGQARDEEIDRSLADSRRLNAGRGANYGWDMYEAWNCFEGPCSPTGKTFPLARYNQGSNDNCAVTGGYVYRGRGSPVLAGRYIFGDFCSGRILMVNSVASPPATVVQLADTSRFISSFGEGVDRELYLTDLVSGELYRLSATQV